MLLDPLLFSSAWLAAAAAALTAAAAQAMGLSADWRAVVLAAAGTLVVYNVDRLRDLARDRRTAPARSAFVSKHRSALSTLVVVAAATSLACALAAGWRAFALLLPVLALGLLHRRLKRFGWVKPLYLAAAWVAVTAGLPLVLAPAPTLRAAAPVVGILFSSVLANAIASNLRDGESRLHPARALAVARAAAALAALAALGLVPSLAGVPALTLLALLQLPAHPGERFGLLAVDGALGLGAALGLGLGS